MRCLLAVPSSISSLYAERDERDELSTVALGTIRHLPFVVLSVLTFLNCSMRSASSLARSNSLLMVKEYFSGRLLFHVTDRGDFGLPPFLLGLLLPGESTHTMNMLCNRVFFLRVGCIREAFRETKRFSYTSTVSSFAQKRIRVTSALVYPREYCLDVNLTPTSLRKWNTTARFGETCWKTSRCSL